jgi:predicted alpha/beta superfamily hydrolase
MIHHKTPMCTPRGWVIVLVAILAQIIAGRAALAQAAGRVTVPFQITQTTTVGKSVFVLGDLPELGGNDVRRAVKLDPSTYPTWRASLSLPEGRSYTYRYYLRDDAPGRTSDSTNGTAVGSLIAASTTAATPTLTSKVIFVHSTNPATGSGAGVSAWYRLGARSGGGTGAYARVDLQGFGPGRTASEKRWFTWKLNSNVVRPGQEIEFYLTNAAGGSRIPATGTFQTFLDGVLVQDGQLYSYVPANSPGVPRRDYSVSSLPSLVSTNLNGERRYYRVYLPRGYDQHPTKRYPLVIFHDGQNIFESGAFGSWNAAPTITTLQQSGQMREVIALGVDNGPNRLTDYLPPDDNSLGQGKADKYTRFVLNELKPIIDAQYRTLTTPSTTGSIGSSMGGVVSLYTGWDFTSSVTRVGLFSGAWWTTPSFLNRVKPAASTRGLRIYIDSGDSGSSNDDYWNTYGLRDSLVGTASPRFNVEGTLRHVVGFGQQHNEAAWSARLPDALRFLYPTADEPNQLLRDTFSPTWDTNADGSVDINDLYTQNQSPKDLNLDGVIDGADLSALENYLQTH